jgi:archaellum biogenesis ATPase FlaH
MGDKLKEIRETTSDAVSIIRELGAPGVQESLGRILETTKAAKEIVDALKEPEFVKNIENIRLTTESIQDASIKFENTIREMKQTGVLEQARETIKAANNVLDSLSSNKDLAEGSEIMKATLSSIRDLVDELKLIAISSKKTGTLSNATAIIKESSDMYRTITGSK